MDLEVYPGQVTALVGDNGAGKSTLIKSIAGIHPIDWGEVLFDGTPVSITGPRDAAALGIEVVYQDLALAELAIALIEGDEDPAAINGEVEDTEGGRQVPSVLLDPISITRENVSEVTEDGQVEASELCTGEYAAACTELGIQ